MKKYTCNLQVDITYLNHTHPSIVQAQITEICVLFSQGTQELYQQSGQH